MLQNHLNFTDEDLAYNRQGQFSPRQLAEEKAAARGCRLYLLIIIVLWLITLGVGLGMDSQRLKEIGYMMTIFGVLALLAFFATFPSKKNPLQVRSVTGKAELSKQLHRSTTILQYTLIINHVAFKIPLAVYDKLETGRQYTVYYWPSSTANQILSMEDA